jgi:hypothetical protein
MRRIFGDGFLEQLQEHVHVGGDVCELSASMAEYKGGFLLIVNEEEDAP